MNADTLRYGDLHLHTRFSDNRYSASVERMVAQGERLGLAGLGCGLTGFWLRGKPTRKAVLHAIRSRRTFAATSQAISLSWRWGEGGELSWGAQSACGDEVESWLFVLGRPVAEGGELGRVKRRLLPDGGLC